jgi:ABC-type oligopeptide transport system, periplasmic component
MKKFISVFISVYILVSVFASCSKNEYLNNMSFNYKLTDSVLSLDPQTVKTVSEKNVVGMIFEGLCRIDNIGNIVPGVAAKWSSNKEHTSYTFRLRKNAQWSDGTPVTAHDFIYGIKRALDPATKAIGVEDLLFIKNAREIYIGEAELDTLGVTATDNFTLVFQLNSSYADFPALTAGAKYMPCNESFFNTTEGKYGLDCSSLLTNGPFTFSSKYSWDNTNGISLTRSNNYHGDDSVSPQYLNLLPSNNTDISSKPLEALKTNAVDFISLAKSDIAEATEQKYNVITLNNSVYGLILNTDNEYLENTSLREIYLRSINREDVISRLNESREEALGIMPKCVKWDGKSFQTPNDTRYAVQDSEVLNNIPSILQSLELKNLPSLTILCPDDNESKNIANSIIISWNQILSTSFNIEPIPESEYKTRLAKGNYQAALYNLTAYGTSPATILRQFSSMASPNILNNPEYDEALANAEYTRESFLELENLLLNEYFFYPICYGHTYFAMSPNVKNITVTADLNVNFIGAKKQE